MAFLNEITQQQITQAIQETDTSSLLHWVLILAETAGYIDPTTGQIISPGLAQLIHAHLPCGIPCHSQLHQALQALPVPYLSALALALSSHACFTTPARHHRPSSEPRPS